MQEASPPIATLDLPADEMPEVEVMLRLAFYLLSRDGSGDECTITPDCQHIESNGRTIFPLASFLSNAGWVRIEPRGNERWEGVYAKDDKRLVITATPGSADVLIRIHGRLIRAECKKGPIVKRGGNPERPIMHAVIGQLMMSTCCEANEILVAAIPDSERFRRLVAACRGCDRLKVASISFALVNRDGSVDGFPALVPALKIPQ